MIFLKDLNLLLVFKDYCLTCKPVHIRFPFLSFGFYSPPLSPFLFPSISIPKPLPMVAGNPFYGRRTCTRPQKHSGRTAIVANAHVIKEIYSGVIPILQLCSGSVR